jgi:hypothetical protein
LNQFYQFKTNYLELESWKKWYFSLVIDVPPSAIKAKATTKKPNPQGKKELSRAERGDLDDEIAVEVLKYRKNLNDFAGKHQGKRRDLT